ncbi:MAG: ABC transporter [Candidatus Woykebacteria bacterium RIFCSPHIGHO2_12_FULL_45_10]|uniref:ABC transporter n=1 Tax=Candidatus Woykebacteria bacterium RIFCSPHIGHO2_12_FULL_45_10 TaxID=1802603 RepID=A0A1G1WQV9_9BACT|nr:MAG: ABC transporter [Candidatus Woykebacteria bacterium RIFCSPHIGHO2_12_FULL_45_10]
MAKAIIKTEKLTKDYGNGRGIFDLDLEVNEGEVFGYLGPNGAGKTTTIRLIMDFLRPTKGKAEIFGLDTRADSVQIKHKIGYLPGDLDLYDNLNGEEFLRYLAALRGGVDWNLVKQLASRIESNLSHPIRSLSHGNKQKLGLIQAFMHKPALLILDEPTTGLDPIVQHEFTHMVAEVKAEGRTVFLSSHILPEVERTCDRVGIIRNGKLVVVENILSLKEHAIRPIEIHFASEIKNEDFVDLKLQDLKIEKNILRCNVPGSFDALVKRLAQFEVVNIITPEPDLEQVFLNYYGKEQADVK